MAASEGVDLEWAIVNLISPTSESMKRTYSSTIKAQADKCVAHIMKEAGNKPVEAWHSDDPKNPAGAAIFAKPEPKTDVVIKIGSKVYYTSVKMAGGVQLASGQGSSTAELFAAASKHLGGAKSKVLESIIKELKSMPTRLLSESNKQRILKEASPKIINEFLNKGKIINDKSYEVWLMNNKPFLMESLIKYVDSDLDFFAALIYEAMSGEETLKQYKGAVADSIISPSGFHEIDIGYVHSILHKIKLDVRGKSRSGITGLAFRIDYTP